MRLSLALLIAASVAAKDVIAFSPNPLHSYQNGVSMVIPKSPSPFASCSTFDTKRQLSSGLNDNDCGCSRTTFSGAPSNVAKELNFREAIRKGSIFSLDSDEVKMDDLLENKNGGNSLSVVVFLRSLG